MIKYIFTLFIGWILLNSFLLAQKDPLVYIENAGTRAGILVEVGGRIVYLNHKGSDNLLKSDPALWNEELSARPDISPDAGWKAYNGHIVWVGPQSEWWVHQDHNRERKAKRSVWPPDPYLIYGDYEILEKDKNSIVLSGPESKISGLKLIKRIKILDDGSLYFEVEGINTRRVAVEWDLWLNTRVNAYAMTYVKVGSEENVRLQANRTKTSDTVRWAVCKDYFYYLPEPPPSGKMQRSSKAFISPSDNYINTFLDKHLLRIEIPETDPEKVHPDQGLIEIYNSTAGDPETSLTELEFHAPYRLLQPGESMKTWEKWKIYSYRGRDIPDAHIKYLNRLNKRNE